jgi:hypothetical protein
MEFGTGLSWTAAIRSDWRQHLTFGLVHLELLLPGVLPYFLERNTLEQVYDTD